MNKKLPILQGVAYSGNVSEVEGRYTVINVDGVVLPPSVPLQLDHSNTIAATIGHATLKKDSGRITFEATITADDEAAARIIKMAAGGTKPRVSVGCDRLETIFHRAGRKMFLNGREIKAGPHGLIEVTSCRIRELSIVGIPADADAGAEAVLARATDMIKLHMERIPQMIDDSTTSDIALQERTRLREIRNIELTSRPAAGWGVASEAVDALVEAAEDGLVDVQSLRAKLGKLRKTSATAASMAFQPAPSRESITDESALRAANIMALGFEDVARRQFDANVLDRAASLNLSFKDVVAAETGWGRNDDRYRLPVALSSSTQDAPTITSSMNVVLHDLLAHRFSSWRAWIPTRSVRDFKEVDIVRMSANVPLERLPENGEISHGTIGEQTAKGKAEMFARQLGIDYQAWVNDSAQAFSDTARTMLYSALRSQTDQVYSTLLNAGTFFHADNGNLETGASSALSIDSIAAVVKKITTQTDASGNYLDLVPQFLIVPPSLEFIAKQLLGSVALAQPADADANTPTANPFLNRMEVVVEPRLEAEPTAWYISSAQSDAPLTVLFLDGQNTPTIETRGISEGDFNRLTFQLRMFWAYGTVLTEPRSIVKATGSE